MSITDPHNYIVIDLPDNLPFTVLGPTYYDKHQFIVECNKCGMRFLLKNDEVNMHTKEFCLLNAVHNS